jgi:hypothetical protein
MRKPAGGSGGLPLSASNRPPGGVDVEIWVALTRFGAPWVVLGTAEDEEVF